MAGGLAEWGKWIADGAKEGWDAIAKAAKNGLQSVKSTADQARQDGVGGTASKLWQGFGDATKNIGMGGLFGGIFGAGLMWLFSSIFAGGMVGNLMALALIPTGIIIGVQQGKKFDGGESLLTSNAAPPQGQTTYRGNTHEVYYSPEASNVYYGGRYQLRHPVLRYPVTDYPPGGSPFSSPRRVITAQPLDFGGRGNGG